jgi:hypothetical protein
MARILFNRKTVRYTSLHGTSLVRNALQPRMCGSPNDTRDLVITQKSRRVRFGVARGVECFAGRLESFRMSRIYPRQKGGTFYIGEWLNTDRITSEAWN